MVSKMTNSIKYIKIRRIMFGGELHLQVDYIPQLVWECLGILLKALEEMSR